MAGLYTKVHPHSTLLFVLCNMLIVILIVLVLINAKCPSCMPSIITLIYKDTLVYIHTHIYTYTCMYTQTDGFRYVYVSL